MPPVQPDGLNPRRCGQFADLCGRGLHHIGASEIVSAGQAIETEAFQGLPDLRHGQWLGIFDHGAMPLAERRSRRRQHFPGRCDRFPPSAQRCAHRRPCGLDDDRTCLAVPTFVQESDELGPPDRGDSDFARPRQGAVVHRSTTQPGSKSWFSNSPCQFMYPRGLHTTRQSPT